MSAGRGRGSVGGKPSKAVQAQPPAAHVPEPTRRTSARGPTAAGTLQKNTWVFQALAIGITLILSMTAAAVWVSGKFEEARKDLASQIASVRSDIAQERSDLSRTQGALEQVDKRLTSLEARVNAKFGTDTDAGPGPDEADAGPPTQTRPWSTEHVQRREHFCERRCTKGRADAACFDACATDYNLCGIKCTPDPALPCFSACEQKIVGHQSP